MGRGRGLGDGVGRGFGGMEVGRGEVEHSKLGRDELGHRLMVWIPTRWVMDSWQR